MLANVSDNKKWSVSDILGMISFISLGLPRPEVWPLDGDPIISEDAAIPRNRLGRVDVVTSNHADDIDTCRLQSGMS